MSAPEAARPVTTCRVCGGRDWQDVASLGRTPLANGFLPPAESYPDEPWYPLGVISCRRCRLMSLTHVVDPTVLYRTYLYVTPDSVSMNRHLDHVVGVCRERFGLAEGAFVVEIGSNTGVQLAAFRAAGMRVLGVDPARNLAAIANINGIETMPDFFTPETARAIARDRGRAPLIVGRHVFAHIDDVAGVLTGVRDLLTPDGVFVIEVPYLVDLLEKVAFDTIYHEHLSYFAVGTLVTLFARYGLRLFDVERLPVHCGSILVFAGRAEGPWQVHPAVDALLGLERRTGLHTDEVYREFARKVGRVRRDLPALVRRLSAGGRRVAGYGAPAKGNTILNVCGLGRDDLEYCSDTTPLKQGKVLPGSHIPVRTPDYARAHPPAYFLLLAWNYADEILDRETAFLEAGGRFILPVPEPAVVAAEVAAPALVKASVTR